MFTLYVLSEIKKDGHPALDDPKLTNELLAEIGLLNEKALKSKDPYYVALIACANLNFGRQEADAHVQHLVHLLKEQGVGHCKVEQTFALSYGKSMQVETAAWSAYTLLKAQQHHAAVFWRPDEIPPPIQKQLWQFLAQRRRPSWC